MAVVKNFHLEASLEEVHSITAGCYEGLWENISQRPSNFHLALQTGPNFGGLSTCRSKLPGTELRFQGEANSTEEQVGQDPETGIGGSP